MASRASVGAFEVSRVTHAIVDMKQACFQSGNIFSEALLDLLEDSKYSVAGSSSSLAPKTLRILSGCLMPNWRLGRLRRSQRLNAAMQ